MSAISDRWQGKDFSVMSLFVQSEIRPDLDVLSGTRLSLTFVFSFGSTHNPSLFDFFETCIALFIFTVESNDTVRNCLLVVA